MPARPLIAAAAVAAIAGHAAASETTRHVYDAEGRLVILDTRRTGVAAGGAFNAHVFDRADNRARSTASGAFRVATLPGNSALAAGQGAMSADGRFLLTWSRRARS